MLKRARWALLAGVVFSTVGCLAEGEQDGSDVGQAQAELSEQEANEEVTDDGRGSQTKPTSEDERDDESDEKPDTWLLVLDPDPEPWTPETNDEGTD